MGIILTIFYFIFMIAAFLNFNGFVRVGTCFSEGAGFSGFLGIIESLTFLLLSLGIAYFTFLIFKNRATEWKKLK